jgi:phosphopantetheinyl transferase
MQEKSEIFTFSRKNTQVFITPNWINLATDEASIQLLDAEKEDYVALKSEKRKKEFLLVRYLRNKIFPAKEIKYTSSGAPYFKDKSYSISISHSPFYVAIAATTDVRIGIDLELIQEKIIPLGKKFMHLNEISSVQYNNRLIAYTQFWCAKEALYKWTNINGLSFQNDLSVIQDETKNWFGISNQISQKLISLEMIEFYDHILCFTY